MAGWEVNIFSLSAIVFCSCHFSQLHLAAYKRDHERQAVGGKQEINMYLDGAATMIWRPALDMQLAEQKTISYESGLEENMEWEWCHTSYSAKDFSVMCLWKISVKKKLNFNEHVILLFLQNICMALLLLFPAPSL